MDKQAKIVQALKNIGKPKGDILLYAEVTAITGDTCTIKINEFELSEVRLKATDNRIENKLLVTPKIGSMVIVGSNHGYLGDLVVLKVDDPEKILYKHEGLTVEIDGKTGNIVINEGKNGGLIIAPTLQDELKKMSQRLDSALSMLKDVTKCTLYPAPAIWDPFYIAQTQTLEKEDFSKIEDEKVKH